MVFGLPVVQEQVKLCIDGEQIKVIDKAKNLGLLLDQPGGLGNMFLEIFKNRIVFLTPSSGYNNEKNAISKFNSSVIRLLFSCVGTLS